MESICVEIDDHYDQVIIAALVMKPRTAVKVSPAVMEPVADE